MLANLLRRSAKILLSGATYLFDTLLLSVPPPRRRAGKRALAVRLDRIGDFILWLPSARVLCADWRARGFTVVGAVTREFADLAHGCGLFDEIVPIDRDRLRLDPLYRLRMLFRIRRLAAEEAIQPVWSRELSVGDAMIRFSRASRRIGWSGDLGNITRLGRWFGDRGYTELFAAPEMLTPEIARNEDFLARLDLAPVPGEGAPLPMAPLDRFALPERYALLAPGANFPGRRWPPRHFAGIARVLQRDHALPSVICGGMGDRILAERIAALAGVPVIDLTGRTSLPELASLIEAARLVICNDTAGVHIAALAGTPSVCVTGGGLHGRFLPYPEGRGVYAAPRVAVEPMPCFQCNWQCRFPREEGGAVRCVAAVTEEAVLREVRAILEIRP